MRSADAVLCATAQGAGCITSELKKAAAMRDGMSYGVEGKHPYPLMRAIFLRQNQPSIDAWDHVLEDQPVWID